MLQEVVHAEPLDKSATTDASVVEVSYLFKSFIVNFFSLHRLSLLQRRSWRRKFL